MAWHGIASERGSPFHPIKWLSKANHYSEVPPNQRWKLPPQTDGLETPQQRRPAKVGSREFGQSCYHTALYPYLYSSPNSSEHIIPFGSGARGADYSFVTTLLVTPSAPLILVDYMCGLARYRLDTLTCTGVRCLPFSPDLHKATMPNKRSGQYFPCKVCGTMVYRQQSLIKRGITVTCGKRECISESMKGANNPFWGKTHSKETIEHILTTKRARPGPRKKTGPPPGWKPNAEHRAAVSAALKERWRTNRDKMLAINPPKNKPREEQRYRFCFTRHHRANWIDTKCAWCDSTEGLVLDHIIPVMCGGINERRNAQTLCQPCNMWKMKHVDRPLFLAGLGSQGGQTQPGVPDVGLIVSEV
jgi:HNH endonuclease/NUMOD3 motif-containing protein